MSARRVRILTLFLLAAVAGASVFVYRTLRTTETAETVRTVTASIGTVTESVTASGSVEAASTRSLNFSASGTITEVLVAVGDRVEPDQPLGRVDGTTAGIQLAQAKSSLKVAKAKLTQLRSGLTAAERRQLDLGVTQGTASVETARRAVAEARAAVALDEKSAALTQEAAGRSAANAATNSSLNATTSQAQLDQAITSLENVKKTAEFNARAALTAVETANANLKNVRANTELAALSYQASVDGAAMALENAKKNAVSVVSANQLQVDQNAANLEKNTQAIAAAELQLSNAKLQQTTNLQRDAQSIATAEAAIATAQNNAALSSEKDAQSIKTAELQVRNAQISRDAAATKDGQSVETANAGLNTAELAKASSEAKNRQSLANAETQLRNAQLNLQTTRLNNSVKLAPAKQAELLAAEASVEQANAAVLTNEEAVAKTTLLSPIAATITGVEAEVGETASTGTGGNAAATTAAFTLTDLDNLYVSAAFSEANAAKLQPGQNATITFDALPNVTVDATVDSVALTATTTANVVSFPVRLKLDPVAVASGVKPGMTAQAEVTTNERVDVVTVPSAAVRSQGGRRIVMLYDATTKVQTPTQVTVGVRGVSTTEIKTGLDAGAVVVLPTQNLTSISAPAAGTTGGLGGLGGGGGGTGFGGGGGGRTGGAGRG